MMHEPEAENAQQQPGEMMHEPEAENAQQQPGEMMHEPKQKMHSNNQAKPEMCHTFTNTISTLA